jgi:hypothetical protein
MYDQISRGRREAIPDLGVRFTVGDAYISRACILGTSLRSARTLKLLQSVGVGSGTTTPGLTTQTNPDRSLATAPPIDCSDFQPKSQTPAVIQQLQSMDRNGFVTQISVLLRAWEFFPMTSGIVAMVTGWTVTR